MSNNFTVVSAVYDGTFGNSGYPDPNPLVTISGTVNGLNVFPRVFFRYLEAANTAGQMQAVLTAILFNSYALVYRTLLQPWPDQIPFPVFPASNAIAVHIQGSYPVAPVSYAPALIGSWMA